MASPIKDQIAKFNSIQEFEKACQKNEIKGNFIQKLAAKMFGTGVSVTVNNKTYTVDRTKFQMQSADDMRSFVKSIKMNVKLQGVKAYEVPQGMQRKELKEILKVLGAAGLSTKDLEKKYCVGNERGWVRLNEKDYKRLEDFVKAMYDADNSTDSSVSDLSGSPQSSSASSLASSTASSDYVVGEDTRETASAPGRLESTASSSSALTGPPSPPSSAGLGGIGGAQEGEQVLAEGTVESPASGSPVASARSPVRQDEPPAVPEREAESPRSASPEQTPAPDAPPPPSSALGASSKPASTSATPPRDLKEVASNKKELAQIAKKPDGHKGSHGYFERCKQIEKQVGDINGFALEKEGAQNVLMAIAGKKPSDKWPKTPDGQNKLFQGFQRSGIDINHVNFKKLMEQAFGDDKVREWMKK